VSDKHRLDEDETFVTPLSTMGGGKAAPAVDSDASVEPPDLLRDALAGAQDMTRSRPRTGGRTSKRRGGDQPGGRNQGGYSGPAPDAADPQLVGDVLSGYVQERGWEQPLAAARVFADWGGLVGADVAVHCRPTSLTQGELRVEAESTAWATQLRLLGSSVLARLVAELGPEVVTKIHFTGPVGPSWKHGGFSVRGARGPRDTYG
jgi:predicted nucleic acid-binding Zn ribbon protein